VSGKKNIQKYFEFAHATALDGMNYGNSGEYKNSGEIGAAEYVKSKLQNTAEKITVFDVGANLGKYAVELANVFSDKCIIYSFEPSLETYNAMVKNVESNNKIIPCNFGFGETETSLKLYTDRSQSGSASIYKRKLDHFNIEMSKHEEVSISTIDNFCLKNNIEKIHFLKLDIEGNEYNALLGAEKKLKEKKINFIQFEFGGCNIDSRTYFQDFWYLLKDDYNFYRIVKNGLRPIKNYSESLEIFITINFLLELKK